MSETDVLPRYILYYLASNEYTILNGLTSVTQDA